MTIRFGETITQFCGKETTVFEMMKLEVEGINLNPAENKIQRDMHRKHSHLVFFKW